MFIAWCIYSRMVIFWIYLYINEGAVQSFVLVSMPLDWAQLYYLWRALLFLLLDQLHELFILHSVWLIV